jgi:single-stranded DNA-binding protein
MTPTSEENAMTATLAVYGRLGRAPRQIDTKGQPMVVTTLAAKLSKDSDTPTWFSVAAFGRQGEDLLRHEQGDLVAVSGRLQLREYETREGEQRSELSVTADSIVSARTVRPGGGRRKVGGTHGHEDVKDARQALDGGPEEGAGGGLGGPPF